MAQFDGLPLWLCRWLNGKDRSLHSGTRSAACVVERAKSHGTRRVLKAPHGAIILSLARQAKVDALPGEASLWLTLPMYSSSLRSANRMLGVTQEAMEKYSQQMRGQSEAQLQRLQVEAGVRRA